MRRYAHTTLPGQPNPPWTTLAGRRAWRLGWLKALGNTLFLWGFFRLYLYIQQHPQTAVTQIPATALDGWIGFQPWALWLYLSLWVYTALPVALQPSWPALRRYGWWIGALCALGLLMFALWPSSVSQAVGPRLGASPWFATLYAMDTNGNACPSLHVAAAVFSALWLRAQGHAMGAPRAWGVVNALWCVGIAVSTMAIKQHLLWDVLAGALLGAAAALPALWRAARGRREPML